MKEGDRVRILVILDMQQPEVGFISHIDRGWPQSNYPISVKSAKYTEMPLAYLVERRSYKSEELELI